MKDDDEDKPRCPDCGGPATVHALPALKPGHFDKARGFADLLWAMCQAAEGGNGAAVSVVCLTAALLFKRASVTLKIPASGAPALSSMYLEAAHDIILRRREAAAAEDDEEQKAN